MPMGIGPAGYLLLGVTQPAQLTKIDSLIVDGQP
jgi:hypothetical protein